jgi:REP element-mobilizing transposase RayT
MGALFRNKYRIGSIRLKYHNYCGIGSYFITICTKNKIRYFGKIENRKMILSELGIIAEKFWREIPGHFPNIKLDEFIIMPDHMHGIIIINDKINFEQPVEPLHATVLRHATVPQNATVLQNATVPQQNAMIQPCPPNEHFSLISPKIGSLGSIIRSYKSVVSKYAHVIDPAFKWQKSYHDHIIRTNTELNRIRKYIRENPEKFIRNSHKI